MEKAMSAALLPILLALAVPPPAAAPVIVVTGRADAKQALEECLARHCPPNEDIDATLAVAEQQFVAGDYHGARTTLLRSLKRNRGEARRYPVPVSDLHRANALVADHLGLERDYYLSTLGILASLKAGIPVQDYRHFGARMEIGAMMTRIGNSDGAAIVYADLAKDARKAGREDVAALAELKRAWLDYGRSPMPATRRRIEAIAGSADPAGRRAAMIAKLYLAVIARREGREAEAEALIAYVGAQNGAAPTLLYAPPYELAVREIESSANPAQDSLDLLGAYKRTSDSFEKKWIDVGFWVQPDGRVGDVEVLRSDGGSGDWARPLLQSIAGRLYSKTASQAPFYRVERYTYTAGYEAQLGSRIERRSTKARVEYLDLTAAPAPPPGG
jgi:hypothetical protein